MYMFTKHRSKKIAHHNENVEIFVVKPYWFEVAIYNLETAILHLIRF